MSYNGSGTFNINSTGQPVVAGTVITASAFNALTTDLATGLTTAITKDGQTTTTARITFAQGITSSLVTDSSSVSTGSIITAGGAGIAKNLYVGGIASFSAQPIFTSLTASSAVATDASKGLVSVTNTGTGNNVLATSPTITTPTISSLSSAAATALTLQSAGTTAITVDTSQNVGIGTASPTQKLQVAGNAFISAGQYFMWDNAGAWALQSDASTYVRTYIAGNEKMRVNAYGIGVGGAIPSSGTGITFPATQSASSDANTLDDYEEGTFTPSITFGGGSTGITYGSSVGLYRKVGSLVVAQVFVTLSNKGSSTGPSNVTGFPFTSTSVSNAFCSATMWASNLTNSGMIYSYISPSATVAQLQQLSPLGANANLTETNFANNTEVMVTVSYQTS